MTSVLASVGSFYRSSIGKKWIVALTGAGLCGFVLVHLIGNLLIFKGPDAINDYAYFLKHSAKGAGVWIFRLGLLVMAALHIVCTVALVKGNRGARSVRYARPQKALESSKASRWMIVSGLIVLGFIGIHLAHFTVNLGFNADGMSRLRDSESLGKPVHDVYSMVVQGFRSPLLAIVYVGSVALLCWHLSHGVASIFQTLGLSTPKTAPIYRLIGHGFAGLIFVGNAAIVLAILFRVVGGDLEFPERG